MRPWCSSPAFSRCSAASLWCCFTIIGLEGHFPSLTLLGWLTLIKAVLLLVLPPTKLVALYGGVSPTYILISGSLTLLLGIYLTVAGFRAPLGR